MDMDTEEIVFHTLFFVCIVSSLGIIFYYRRTTQMLVTVSLFFASFMCTMPAMYISSIIFKLLEKKLGIYPYIFRLYSYIYMDFPCYFRFCS